MGNISLRMRKKKGTLNPLVSVTKILTLLALSLIGLIAYELKISSELMILRLSEFTVTVGTAASLNV